MAKPITDLAGDGHVDEGIQDLTTADLIGVDLASSTPPFGTPVSYAVENGPIYLASTDLNGDGHPDLVVANVNDPDGTITGTSTPSSVNVLLGNGDGTFQAKVSISLGNTVFSVFSVSTSDLNGDGHPDVVVTEGDGIDVLLGSAAGVLGAPTHILVGTSGFDRSNAIGDIDGDGHLDVVVADQGDGVLQGLVWVLRGDGTGSFGSQTSFPVSVATDGNIRYANAVRLGYMDNDTKLDVVTANVNTNSISILVNTSTVGTASLGSPVEITRAEIPQDIVVAQLDSVNKTDIVVVDLAGNAVDVYLSQDGTAALTYNAPAVYTTAVGPTAVATADIDSDTKIDLVVAGGSSDQISILYGSSAGTFNVSTPARPGTQTIALPANSDPISIVSGVSFNADTKQDIATANQISNTVSVALNQL